jgi:hypothetical protein
MQVGEVVKLVQARDDKAEKIELLKKNMSRGLTAVLKLNYEGGVRADFDDLGLVGHPEDKSRIWGHDARLQSASNVYNYLTNEIYNEKVVLRFFNRLHGFEQDVLVKACKQELDLGLTAEDLKEVIDLAISEKPKKKEEKKEDVKSEEKPTKRKRRTRRRHKRKSEDSDQ